jgi:hypothetical protein
MSMAHALEVRSPLLDHRVHEWAARLPTQLKLRRGTMKWPLKELARRRGMPDALVDRPKKGFGIPVGEWFRADLRPWLEDVLFDSRTTDRGLFRREGWSACSQTTSRPALTTPRDCGTWPCSSCGIAAGSISRWGCDVGATRVRGQQISRGISQIVIRSTFVQTVQRMFERAGAPPQAKVD